MPIPDSHAKERISEMLVAAIAHEAGYSLERHAINDYGVDAELRSVEFRAGQYRTTGASVQVQLNDHQLKLVGSLATESRFQAEAC
jgi:hypothetical protein